LAKWNAARCIPQLPLSARLEGRAGTVVARYRDKFTRRYFRSDTAVANPEVCEFLKADSFRYAIRLPGRNPI
jgi:hypothetical protein